jgi:sporulation protein YlmC with PRC-barrel domain
MMETRVELLLGANVRDVNGEKVGRIEEIRVERTDTALLVESYLIGASALVDRLSAWTLIRPIKGLLKSRHIYSLYDVPWQDMDLSDPIHPVLRRAKGDLHHAR